MEVIEAPQLRHGRADTFHIVPLGDAHAGSVNCAEHELKRKVEEIRTSKNTYWVGMGDFCDAILQHDKRFDAGGLAAWVERDNIIESQRKWVKELIAPIKHKCLAFLEGNHEETIHRFYQDDVTRNICADSKLPYGGVSCFLVLRFERHHSNDRRQYVFHLFHGAGVAQSEGARIMRLTRLVNEIEADVYLMGHLHCVATYTPDRLAYRNGRIKSHNIIAAMTGSWLKTYNQPNEGEHINSSYAEAKGYKPSRIGTCVIHIQPDKNIITVES